MPRLSKYHDVTKDLNPDDYTMEEIQKQMAIYNRLYYLKNLQKEGWMERKPKFPTKTRGVPRPLQKQEDARFIAPGSFVPWPFDTIGRPLVW